MYYQHSTLGDYAGLGNDDDMVSYQSVTETTPSVSPSVIAPSFVGPQVPARRELPYPVRVPQLPPSVRAPHSAPGVIRLEMPRPATITPPSQPRIAEDPKVVQKNIRSAKAAVQQNIRQIAKEKNELTKRLAKFAQIDWKNQQRQQQREEQKQRVAADLARGVAVPQSAIDRVESVLTLDPLPPREYIANLEQELQSLENTQMSQQGVLESLRADESKLGVGAGETVNKIAEWVENLLGDMGIEF